MFVLSSWWIISVPCRYKKKLILFTGLAGDEKALERAQRVFLPQITCMMDAVGLLWKWMCKEPRTKHKSFIVPTTWNMIDYYNFIGVLLLPILNYFKSRMDKYTFVYSMEIKVNLIDLNEAKIILILLWLFY